MVGRRSEWCLAALLGATLAIGTACGDDKSSSSHEKSRGGSGGIILVGGSGGGAARGGTGGTITLDGGDDDAGCRRDVSLQAVTLGEPAPFDLVIVADHSGSLAWSRDELTAGLGNLLTNVEGRDVRVFILTPTQYGESSSAAILPLQNEPVVPWKDPATGRAYEDAATDYSQICTSPEGAVIDCPSPLGPTPYHVEGTWSFVMPDPIAVIRPDMTSAEFRAEQDAVAEAILAIGGTGSPQEQPLCTLARYFSQDASLMPENATFLLISDEDDVSTPRECLAGWTGDVQVTRNESGTTPCSSGCDAYRFGMTGDSYAKGFSIVCAAFDDLGNPIRGSEQMQYASQPGLPSCSGVTPGPCTQADEDLVDWVCESGKKITSCTVDCAMSGNNTCSVDVPTPDVNPCTGSFSYQGRTWSNLAEYCATRGSGWRDCRGGGVNIQYSENLSGGASMRRLMPGETTADVASYVRTKADALFEPESYMIEGLVFDPAFSCELGMGQSYATNLVTFIGDRSKVFPLCESYAPVLDGVLDFAQALIQTRFTLDLKDDEDVTEVIVIDRDGGQRSLSSREFSYDRDTKVLTVSRDAIHATDANLRVEITSDCRPVVK
ncbi:MAG TPA: hypothetical protein VF103_15480 [Polyangiaceae bacterium]